MKVTQITLILLGALAVSACGQASKTAALPTATLSAVTANVAVQPVVAVTATVARTPSLPALSPNPSSRLQEAEPAMPRAAAMFRIYGLGGLAATAARTAEQYQQDVAAAVTRNLAARLAVAEDTVRIISIEDSDVTANADCGGKNAGPAPDQRLPGFEVIAEAGGLRYRFVASGALGWYCGQQ